MDIEVHVINVLPAVRNHSTPLQLKHRGRSDVWYVRKVPIYLEQPQDIEWSLIRTGDGVTIPLFPYLTPADPSMTIAAMLRIQFHALELARRYKDVVLVRMVVGSPIELVADENAAVAPTTTADRLSSPKSRVWFGFGVQVSHVQ